MRRYLAMPDLSRTPGSPLYEIVKRTLSVKSLENFDTIKIPEIIPADILFDLFNMPAGHPARSKSDTYYVDERSVLRTHDRRASALFVMAKCIGKMRLTRGT
jgi:phenylalanyl-tRNA synthetase alpha chain